MDSYEETFNRPTGPHKEIRIMSEQNNPMPSFPINVVFDGPPGHKSGRFVEVEDDSGKSISIGKWIKRPDGLWSLQIEPTLAKNMGET